MPNSAAALALTVAALFLQTGSAAAHLDAAGRLATPVLTASMPAWHPAPAALDMFAVATLPADPEALTADFAQPWDDTLPSGMLAVEAPHWMPATDASAALQHREFSAAAVAISGTEPGPLGVLAVGLLAVALTARGRQGPDAFAHIPL